MIRLQDFKTADDRQVYYIEDHCADGGVPLAVAYGSELGSGAEERGLRGVA